MPLTQHYRVYKGGLPHAVFRTDYMARLRSLLPSPEGSDPSPETGGVLTPKSVRRPHRLSQPKQLFPEAVGNGPFLTEQNPAEMVGEMVVPITGIDSIERAEPRYDIRSEELCKLPTPGGDRTVHNEHGY